MKRKKITNMMINMIGHLSIIIKLIMTIKSIGIKTMTKIEIEIMTGTTIIINNTESGINLKIKLERMITKSILIRTKIDIVKLIDLEINNLTNSLIIKEKIKIKNMITKTQFQIQNIIMTNKNQDLMFIKMNSSKKLKKNLKIINKMLVRRFLSQKINKLLYKMIFTKIRMRNKREA